MHSIRSSVSEGKLMRALVGGPLLAALAVGCSDRGEVEHVEDVEEIGQPIWYGDASAANLSVVELRRSVPGGSEAVCTGFFITRRHIVTAAHCTDSAYISQWYKVRIKTGYNTFTNLKDSARSDTWVLLTESTHPGWNFSSRERAADTAILSIPSTVQGSVPPSQQLSPISTIAPATGSLMQIWGWGIRVPDTAPAGDLLTGNGGAQVTVSGIATNGSSNWVYAYVNNNARTCSGDSGGPATRYADGYYIAVGDHRGPYYADGSGSFWPCAESGVRMDWPTLYDKTSWIESTLGLTCTRVASGGYMRCF
jgi:hypothetical protein